MTDEKLEAIKKRCEALTPPGPWTACESQGTYFGVRIRYAVRFRKERGNLHPTLLRCQDEYDASAKLTRSEKKALCLFVASAATDVPALVAEVEWLRRLLAECKDDSAAYRQGVRDGLERAAKIAETADPGGNFRELLLLRGRDIARAIRESA